MRALVAGAALLLSGCATLQGCPYPADTIYIVQNASPSFHSWPEEQQYLFVHHVYVGYRTGLDCLCPESTASDGSSCGGRSAYLRSGGVSVTCYAHEVTPENIAGLRELKAAAASPACQYR